MSKNKKIIEIEEGDLDINSTVEVTSGETFTIRIIARGVSGSIQTEWKTYSVPEYIPHNGIHKNKGVQIERGDRYVKARMVKKSSERSS